ncbi:MAG: alpha/beta hydrolase [Burkholderiaceae bacterium]
MKYTVEFCEREYNARAAIPDHPQIFARWAEQAAATRRLRPCLVDLPYGESSAEKLDLFPARNDNAPLLVFIHGGYWRSLDKSDFSWVASPFVNHGIAVALPNYGLAPKVALEDIVRQTLRALAWLYRNADQYGFDPNRIYVSGHSAGAHLTAMTMAALWDVYAPDLPRNLVKGGLAISGLYDLEPLVHAPFVNVDLKLDVARARRLSPAYMPPATRAPLYTAVGALESSEFRRQNALIGRRWSANLVRDVPMPGCNHLTVCDELASPASPLFDAAIELVRRRVET